MKNLIVLIILISFGCSQIAKNNEIKKDKRILDTLHAPQKSFIVDGTCSQLLAEYYQRFGIFISNYYLVEDSLPVDLNFDNELDRVVVMSPVSLELLEIDSCVHDSSPNRILVEVFKDNNKSYIRNVYSNLISDVGGVLSPYNGMALTENGFAIKHMAGAKYSWEYIMEFGPNQNKIFVLKKIIKVCSYDGSDKKIEYLYNDFDMKSIKIKDTLNTNCGCDNIWHELEK